MSLWHGVISSVAEIVRVVRPSVANTKECSDEENTFGFTIAPRKNAFFLRIALGLMTAYHGLEVFTPEKMAAYAVWDSFSHYTFPLLPVYVGKSAELIAGLLLMPGLLTRFAALLVIFTMAYIVFFIGEGRVWYEEQHPFLVLLFGVLFLFGGGGRWSADHLIFDKKSSRVKS